MAKVTSVHRFDGLGEHLSDKRSVPVARSLCPEALSTTVSVSGEAASKPSPFLAIRTQRPVSSGPGAAEQETPLEVTASVSSLMRLLSPALTR